MRFSAVPLWIAPVLALSLWLFVSFESKEPQPQVFDEQGGLLPSAFDGIPPSPLYLQIMSQARPTGRCKAGVVSKALGVLKLPTVSAMDCPSGDCGGAYMTSQSNPCSSPCEHHYWWHYSDPNSAGPGDGWAYGGTACCGQSCRESAC
ncbi:MAG: hypothetical protein K2X35_19090 [Bryobacteraceae bacterium]|nr:hypothetical protein [Bryobacteraceae bacterium]